MHQGVTVNDVEVIEVVLVINIIATDLASISSRRYSDSIIR